MSRRLGLCVLGFLTLVVVASAATAGGGSDARPQVTPPLTTPDEFENTLFRIRVHQNGSTRWTIQHARPLENETQIDRFEDFAAEFNGEETRTYTTFRRRARQLVRFGRNVTGRDMEARGFRREAFVSELGQTRGVVEMSFRWTGFATVDGDRVEVGDVFEGGMYIGDGQRLELRRGPALAFDEVRPAPDSMATEGSLARSESVTWIDEEQFADQRPHAVFVPRSAVSNGTAGTGGSDGGTAGNPGADGAGLDGLSVYVGGFLLLAVFVGGLAWYAGYFPAGNGGDTAPESSEAGAVDQPASPPSPAPVTDEKLLSDEDRVLKLLDENGGRMKQVSIVEETDWSKSKVSMLLSDMEEADQISKLRLGRENIISLAGQEPEAAGSPFEDDE
jgi:hypothetical protein